MNLDLQQFDRYHVAAETLLSETITAYGELEASIHVAQ